MNNVQTINISLGQLIHHVFETYEGIYQDAELAAVATEVTLGDFIFASDTNVLVQATQQPTACAA